MYSSNSLAVIIQTNICVDLESNEAKGECRDMYPEFNLLPDLPPELGGEDIRNLPIDALELEAMGNSSLLAGLVARTIPSVHCVRRFVNIFLFFLHTHVITFLQNLL